MPERTINRVPQPWQTEDRPPPEKEALMRRLTDADLMCEALQVPFEHGTVYVTQFDVSEQELGYDTPIIRVDAHLRRPPAGKTTWDHDDVHAMYRYVISVANDLGLDRAVTAVVATSSYAPLA
jgi:hypothetical protein